MSEHINRSELKRLVWEASRLGWDEADDVAAHILANATTAEAAE